MVLWEATDQGIKQMNTTFVKEQWEFIVTKCSYRIDMLGNPEIMGTLELR